MEDDLRGKEKWVLRLLYAPDRYGRNKRPIVGKTRIMKAMFLLDRKLLEHFDIETGFDFHPDKYGPFDPDMVSVLDTLEGRGYVEITEPENHGNRFELPKYEVTVSGGKLGEELFDDLDEDVQDLVSWIKKEHATKRLGELLIYVYDEYPEMTTKPELV